MTLTIAALVCAFFGVAWLAGARGAARRRNWSGAVLRTLLALVFLLLGALLGTITVGVRGYHALTLEQLAATVKTEPTGPQRFRATITLADSSLAMYDILGDAFYIDARILKWPAWANVLGLSTAYQLDRVAGRYNDVAAERSQPHTAYSLAKDRPLDLFFLAKRTLLHYLVDAEYGSAAFVPGNHAAAYEVRVSTTGLLMRPVLPLR